MKKIKNRCYKNREMSWLQFNGRVLEEADDISVPLCERLSFLSIYQTNLDEFFMVRVGALTDQMHLSAESRDNKTHMTAGEQISAVLKQARLMGGEKDRVYASLMTSLEAEGVRLVNFSSLSHEEGKAIERYFDTEISPLLSSIVVGKKQPFPFLKNKEIYAVAVMESKNVKEKIGIIPCAPGLFSSLVPVGSKPGAFMLAEEIILHFLPKVFKNYKIYSKSLIRITRNADIDNEQIYDEDLDYLEQMEKVIKRRRKLAPVRMEYTRRLDGDVTEKLCGYMNLRQNGTFYSESPLDLSFFSDIRDILRNRESLFFKRRSPQKPAGADESRSILSQAAEKDILLMHPYESMHPVIRLLHEAAHDTSVVSIKMTLYRLARESKIVNALIDAAENGKQVDVLVELKARFDEENNIEWSRRLEEAGCHVIYGLDDLKVHSKLCLITRKTSEKIEYITHVGTGNYNENTAKLYTDLSLITANPLIGKDAALVFQSLSLGQTVTDSRCLLVAPNCLQNRIIEKIERQRRLALEGRPAYIGIKINSLTDKTIIDALIRASMAGVKIDMAVRGICCLQSKIPALTDNIRVISIVGRYLEHSRIYIFGLGGESEIYISSADFMTRNTLRRVEAAAPIYDKKIKKRICSAFALMLAVKAREQEADGSYRRIPALTEPVNSQEIFYELAYAAAENRPSPYSSLMETALYNLTSPYADSGPFTEASAGQCPPQDNNTRPSENNPRFTGGGNTENIMQEEIIINETVPESDSCEKNGKKDSLYSGHIEKEKTNNNGSFPVPAVNESIRRKSGGLPPLSF